MAVIIIFLESNWKKLFPNWKAGKIQLDGQLYGCSVNHFPNLIHIFSILSPSYFISYPLKAPVARSMASAFCFSVPMLISSRCRLIS